VKRCNTTAWVTVLEGDQYLVVDFGQALRGCLVHWRGCGFLLVDVAPFGILVVSDDLAALT